MRTAAIAGGRTRPRDAIMRLACGSWRRKLTMNAKHFFSASPFGDRLSDAEFAFCLLLIEAH